MSDVRRRLGPGQPLPTPGSPQPPAWSNRRVGPGVGPAVGGIPAPGHMPNVPLATPKSPAQIRELASQRFPERMKSGQLDAVVRAPNAQQLKLADQYKMAQQGDFARRMALQKNVTNMMVNKNLYNINHIPMHHVDHYHGYVSPMYVHSSFKYHYWGPSFFAGVTYYPTWSPWVAWSWRYHCHPIWDPRPIWCRPIIYAPSPVWVYYEPVVWVPLPEASCGTWVDVKPVVVAPADYNLQLLAVRFVDPGHPEERQGPRYRVWFRNNSLVPVTQPFNVVTMGSVDGRLVPGLPQAGARVTSIEAGDTQSVDLRLPYEVYTMARDAAGNPSPYTTVHVMVDAHREIPQSVRTNNGTTIPLTDVLPVDPAAFELDPTTATPGSEILLAGEGFGPEAGRVIVHVNGQELDGEILGWYDLGVRAKLPNVAVAGAATAEVIVVRGDGAAANPLKVTLAAAAPMLQQ